MFWIHVYVPMKSMHVCAHIYTLWLCFKKDRVYMYTMYVYILIHIDSHWFFQKIHSHWLHFKKNGVQKNF